MDKYMDKSTLMLLAEHIADAIGSDTMLEELLNAQDDIELKENLQFICKNYDLEYNEEGEIING